MKKRHASLIKKFLPIGIILLFMIIGYALDLQRFFNFETLRYQHVEMIEYVNNNPIMTPFMYMGAYAVLTALSIPGGLVFSLLGGYLFPQPLCTLYVLIGATTGACLLFLAAKTALGELLKKKAGSRLAKMEKGFNENAANYLLFLRFVPLFPFWLVNIAPAFFKVRFRTYLWTTLVGITPGAFVFTQAGRGLNQVFESDQGFSIGALLNPELKIALICLGIFALLPVVLKKLWRKKGDR